MQPNDGIKPDGEVHYGGSIFENYSAFVKGVVENFLTAYGGNTTEMLRYIAREKSYDEQAREFFECFMPPDKVEATGIEYEDVRAEIENFLEDYRD